MRSRRIALGLVVVAAILLGVLQLPVDVPDTSSPPEGNHTGEINDSVTIGQTLVVSRDGLDRIDVTLAVEQPVDYPNIAFRIQEMPWKESREVTRSLLSLPVGKAGDLRPGTITQRWSSFEFDPIANSGGKPFYFSLEARGLASANSAGLLMFFHNMYPLGEAYVNGNPAGGHVVFRAYTRGKVMDLVGLLAVNAAANQPGVAGSPLFYGLVALFYSLVGIACVQAIRRSA